MHLANVAAMNDPRLERHLKLTPGNASAAILTIDGRYLLQLRDSRPDIFFPSHWGCFGGATDEGETPEQTLLRELKEELGLELSRGSFKYFTRFDFDLDFAGLPPFWRFFYEADLPSQWLPQIQLGEGCDFGLFEADKILAKEIDLAPYDEFALWFHINRGRLKAASS
jgi:8-oxo-dGTP pyrophosphatase MutT (NUDIX family)